MSLSGQALALLVMESGQQSFKGERDNKYKLLVFQGRTLGWKISFYCFFFLFSFLFNFGGKTLLGLYLSRSLLRGRHWGYRRCRISVKNNAIKILFEDWLLFLCLMNTNNLYMKINNNYWISITCKEIKKKYLCKSVLFI